MSSGVEQAAPAQPRVATEAAVERHELGALLEGEPRRGTHPGRGSRAAAGAGRARRSATSGCRPPAAAGRAAPAAHRRSRAPPSTGSGLTKTRGLVASRTTPASATSLRATVDVSGAGLVEEAPGEPVVRMVGAVAGQQDIDVREQHRRPPRRAARRSTTDRSTAAGRRRRRCRQLARRRRRPAGLARAGAGDPRSAAPSGSFLPRPLSSGLPQELIREVDGGPHAAETVSPCAACCTRTMSLARLRSFVAKLMHSRCKDVLFRCSGSDDPAGHANGTDHQRAAAGLGAAGRVRRP